jgi:hypothetical protein
MELAIEARKYAETKPDIYSVAYDKKFAELIVRECAVYCAGHILPTKTAEENDLNYNDGIMDCAIGLKQHFGVEE